MTTLIDVWRREFNFSSYLLKFLSVPIPSPMTMTQPIKNPGVLLRNFLFFSNFFAKFSYYFFAKFRIFSWNFRIIFFAKILHFTEKPQMKINSLRKQKHWCIVHTRSDKAFKGTVVNQALSSLHEGILKIMLTVPFKFKRKFNT